VGAGVVGAHGDGVHPKSTNTPPTSRGDSVILKFAIHLFLVFFNNVHFVYLYSFSCARTLINMIISPLASICSPVVMGVVEYSAPSLSVLKLERRSQLKKKIMVRPYFFHFQSDIYYFKQIKKGKLQFVELKQLMDTFWVCK